MYFTKALQLLLWQWWRFNVGKVAIQFNMIDTLLQSIWNLKREFGDPFFHNFIIIVKYSAGMTTTFMRVSPPIRELGDFWRLHVLLLFELIRVRQFSTRYCSSIERWFDFLFNCDWSTESAAIGFSQLRKNLSERSVSDQFIFTHPKLLADTGKLELYHLFVKRFALIQL